MVGSGFTVTVTFAESEQPPLVPTTVYVVVETIVAFGLGHVVQLNPVAGFQLYTAAPFAFNVMLEPLHTAGTAGVTVTFNVAATVTVTVCVDVQAPLVPVTV
jgi:hypothetical protein